MRKFLLSFVIIVCMIFGASGMAACAPSGLEDHSWSKYWTSNIDRHWHKCLNSGCVEREHYEDHDWTVTDVYEEPTCGETGLGQYTCSVCKATLGNKTTPAIIPATGEHDYELDTLDLEPTCGEEGFGSYICKVCLAFVILPIDATGEHDYGGAYVANEKGHYHVCRNDCGVDEEVEPHVKGEGIRYEPVGTKDGRIEYRCTVCNYLLESSVIENTNALHHFEVKFVKVGDSSNVAIPEEGDDDELYVTLSSSENSSGGYKIEFTGYTVAGNTVSVSLNNVNLYYYNEYTGETRKIELGNSGTEATGYLGFVNNWFFVARKVADVSLLIEVTQSGREPVYLKVHIKAIKAT